MRTSFALRWVLPVAGLCAAAAAAYVVTVPVESKPRHRVLISCGNLTGMLLSELSINPTTLATLGADAGQVNTIVSAARALCESEGGAYGQAQVACEEAQRSLHALELKASHGGLRDADRVALDNARSNVEDLIAARSELVAQVEQVVISTLNQQQRATWHNIRAAKDIEVAVPYKVVVRDQAAWVALRDRLSEERTVAMAGGGNPVPQGPNTPGLPDAPDGNAEEPEVQVAQAALENNLQPVEDAWRAAMSN